MCSLKYNRNHICGLTLLSGPPHHTVIVGAAHCFSPGDAVRSYTVTCGEHSLRSRGEYEVRQTNISKLSVLSKSVHAHIMLPR